VEDIVAEMRDTRNREPWAGVASCCVLPPAFGLLWPAWGGDQLGSVLL